MPPPVSKQAALATLISREGSLSEWQPGAPACAVPAVLPPHGANATCPTAHPAAAPTAPSPTARPAAKQLRPVAAECRRAAALVQALPRSPHSTCGRIGQGGRSAPAGPSSTVCMGLGGERESKPGEVNARTMPIGMGKLAASGCTGHRGTAHPRHGGLQKHSLQQHGLRKPLPHPAAHRVLSCQLGLNRAEGRRARQHLPEGWVAGAVGGSWL